MNNKNIFRRLFSTLLAGWLLLGHANSGHAQNYPNVTNFGAYGDLLTLTNVSTISNSTAISCPSANFQAGDVGKLIEVFGGGTWRNISNEDLITTISAVSSPSTITVATVAGATASSLNGVYGTDDTVGFAAAIAACALPTDTITIPEGNYLLISPTLKTGVNVSRIAVNLPRGGITFAGQGNAILTGCGGWKDIVNVAVRGQMFGWDTSIGMTDDLPLVFTNLTLDGGVAVGNIHNLSFPVSGSTGIGWDGSHHWMAFGGGGFDISSIVMQNCVVQHWRGEMMEMGNVSPNNFLYATNCLFWDGDASCINNFAHDCVSCTFSNVNQAEEFYRSFTTNASLMANCQFYLMSAGIAVNGGYYGDPAYTIVGNTFSTNCANALFTTPGCDIVFVSNNIYGNQGISLGTAGYQGSTVNSNIVVAWNVFSNVQYALIIAGSGQNSCENVYFFSNQVSHAFGIGTIYGWSTNVCVSNNTCSAVGSFAQGNALGQYFLDQNNNYGGSQLGGGGEAFVTSTNIFSYANGSLGTMVKVGAASVFGLDDTKSAKIPIGARMTINNANSSNQTYPLYLNSTFTGTPVSVANGASVTVYWHDWNNSWSTNNKPPPPTNVRQNF